MRRGGEAAHVDADLGDYRPDDDQWDRREHSAKSAFRNRPGSVALQSAKHFCSWLVLCPGVKISEGEVLAGKSKRSSNRVARELKLAAAALRTS